MKRIGLRRGKRISRKEWLNQNRPASGLSQYVPDVDPGLNETDQYVFARLEKREDFDPNCHENLKDYAAQVVADELFESLKHLQRLADAGDLKAVELIAIVAVKVVRFLTRLEATHKSTISSVARYMEHWPVLISPHADYSFDCDERRTSGQRHKNRGYYYEKSARKLFGALDLGKENLRLKFASKYRNDTTAQLFFSLYAEIDELRRCSVARLNAQQRFHLEFAAADKVPFLMAYYDWQKRASSLPDLGAETFELWWDVIVAKIKLSPEILKDVAMPSSRKKGRRTSDGDRREQLRQKALRIAGAAKRKETLS
jgi:hypothetical protein